MKTNLQLLLHKATLCLCVVLCISFETILGLTPLSQGSSSIPTQIYSHVLGKLQDGLIIAGGITDTGYFFNGEGYFLNLSTIMDTTSTTTINSLEWSLVDLPSNAPSNLPTNQPTINDCDFVNLTSLAINHTLWLLCAPTFMPSPAPSNNPSVDPSMVPSNQPTTAMPTMYFNPNDSMTPTFTPSTGSPTMTPTTQPTSMPITPSSETIQGHTFEGQMSFMYDGRLFIYDETGQLFYVFRQVYPYNVTKTLNMSMFQNGSVLENGRFPIENVCVTHSETNEAAYVIGNYNGTTVIVQYNLEGGNWMEYNYWDALDEVIERPFCMFGNGMLYLFGGYLPSVGVTTNDILRFGFNDTNWTMVYEGLEQARYFGQSALLGNYVMMLGGMYKENINGTNIEYIKNNTEVFRLDDEHLLGYGPDLVEAVTLYASYWDEDLKMLFVTGGINENDEISNAWSYFDLRGNRSITDYMKIPTSQPTAMPTDPTCIEDEFRGFYWPETVMYQYGKVACEYGYHGTSDKRYCNYYETWDDKVIFGCFLLSWTEDWDTWDNDTWVAVSGLDLDTDPDADGSQFFSDGQLQLEYTVGGSGNLKGEPDVVRSRITQPLPGRFIINLYKEADECNNFVIAWGKGYEKFTDQSFRLSWDCYLGSWELSNSTYLNFDGQCWEGNYTSMEVVVSVYPDGFVNVETDTDCEDVSIWVFDMEPLINNGSNETVINNNTYLYLTTDGSTRGVSTDYYQPYGKLLARFGTVQFTQFFSNFDGHRVSIWDDWTLYNSLVTKNDYLAFQSEDCCDQLNSNSSWYEFNAPIEARAGIVDSNVVKINNVSYGSDNVYLQWILFGDGTTIDVKNLQEDNYQEYDVSYVAVIYDSIITQKRIVVTDAADDFIYSNECDWSKISTDSGNDGTLSHEVIITIDDNGLLQVKDELCGISLAKHNLGDSDLTQFSVGMYYTDDILKYMEENHGMSLIDTPNITANGSIYTVFDYVQVAQLENDVSFVSTMQPSMEPSVEPTIYMNTTYYEEDIGSVLSYKNGIICCALCMIWNLFMN